MTFTARIKNKDITTELEFIASKSGGPGGQNVNKVNSKVSLRFNVQDSALLNDDEKTIISDKLSSRISTDGILIVSSQNKRTQLQNKEAAIIKFNQLMGKAFSRKKARKATKPTKSSVKKRLNNKKMHSEKKQMRRNLDR